MISEPLNPSRSTSGERVRTISLTGSWDRIGLAAVLVLAGVLNFYGLNREGYGNTYYAAAVRSMLENWHNFFFNSFDPGGNSHLVVCEPLHPEDRPAGSHPGRLSRLG